MSTTASGVPRVGLARPLRAKPLEATAKRMDPKKKSKAKDDGQDDIIEGWRKK